MPLVKDVSPRLLKEPCFSWYTENKWESDPILLKVYDADNRESDEYYVVVRIWGEKCTHLGPDRCPLVRGHHGPCWKASEELMEEIEGALAILYTWGRASA